MKMRRGVKLVFTMLTLLMAATSLSVFETKEFIPNASAIPLGPFCFTACYFEHCGGAPCTTDYGIAVVEHCMQLCYSPAN
jgi:hypothetical protein